MKRWTDTCIYLRSSNEIDSRRLVRYISAINSIVIWIVMCWYSHVIIIRFYEGVIS